jgi:4-hydroxybenzoate polyprenyltransferase
MGWTSMVSSISIEPIILYLSAIFWTLGYDTVYGLQDMHDDEIIGVKSTSIKFKNNVKVFVATCYGICVFFILIMLLMIEINKYHLLLTIPFVFSFAYQIKTLEVDNPSSCLATFKSNNLTGLLIFLFIFSFNIL